MPVNKKQLIGFLILMAVTVFAQAGREITDPYKILHRYYEATGGLEKQKAVKSLYIEGTIVLTGTGLKGTLKQWSESPQKERTEVDLTIIKQTDGDNGEIAWVMDTNGKVSIQKDDERIKRRKIKALMNTYEFLDPNSKHFNVTFEGIEKVGENECYVVKIANTINRDIRIQYHNIKNFLLVKSTEQQPDQTTHILFSDYRKVGGILSPHKLHQETLPIGQKTEIQISGYERDIAIDPLLFEPPQKDVRDFAFLKGESAEDIPFKFIGRHLYLHVNIEGDKNLWCLDSGAEISVIDSAYAAQLGLKPEGNIKGRGVAKTIRVAFVKLPPFKIPGIKFNSQKVASIGIKELFYSYFGLEVVGILGYDFLSRFVTKIDYANRKISFYHPDTFQYKGKGHTIDAPLKSNTFTVPITVDGKYTGKWSLDLGAGGMDFHYPFAEENGFLTRKGVDRIGAGAGGSYKSRTIQFNTIEFAGFTVEKPQIVFPLQEIKGAFSDTELIGNVGNTLFRHFVMILDYKRQQVIVEKGKDFQREFPVDRSGLQVIHSGDGSDIEVLFIAPGTPAEKAGFKKGDIIKSVNNIDIHAFNGILALRDLLLKPQGTQYLFHVLRKGKIIKIRLTLQDLFTRH